MTDLREEVVEGIEPAVEQVEAVLTRVASKAKTLLESLGIKTVISVDDINANEDGTADEVGEKLAASDELLATVALALVDQPRFAEVDEDDYVAVFEYLRVEWDRLDPLVKLQVTGAARNLEQDRADKLEAGEIEDDLRAEVVMQDVFGVNFDYHALSLGEWRTLGEGLLAAGERCLVLFDQSFTRERAGSDRLGEELLEELLKEQRENVWAGLLTYTANDGEAEQLLTQNLRSSHPDVASRIAVIGKFRTTNPDLLPMGLRALLLVEELSAYRVLVEHSIAAAAAAATTSFSHLSDVAIVESFAAAQTEGTFELDQPVRVPQRAFANSVTRELRSASFAEDHLSRLRGKAVEAFRSAGKDIPQLRQIHRADRFELTDHVNELGLPLEIGDLFKLETLYGDGRPADYFVLLGQACDLSMRPRGVRAPDLRVATLSRVLPLEEGFIPPTKAPIGYLEEDSDVLWAADLRAVHGVPVSLDVLDATVFNRDGRSLISLSYEESRPMAMGWQLRLKALKKSAKTSLAEYERLLAAVPDGPQRDDVARAIAIALTSSSRVPKHGPTVEMDASGKWVRYGVQRIGRLRPDFALAVAGAASQYQSRPAYDADLVEVPR
jgi:hypothetical protein